MHKHQVISIFSKIREHSALRFVVLFFVLYFALYGLNYLLTAALAPGGLYLSWLDKNVDYVSGLRNFFLHGTQQVISWFGYKSYIQGNILWVQYGRSIRMVYSCIGLNVILFWWAFVFSFPFRWLSRLVYFFSGTLLIVAINLARLSLLTMTEGDSLFLGLDHHSLFNIVSYGIIFLFIMRIVSRHTGFAGKGGDDAG